MYQSQDGKPVYNPPPSAANTGFPVSANSTTSAANTGFPVSANGTTSAACSGPSMHTPPPLLHKPLVQWSTGLCDCCSNPGHSCLTFFCPCITFGQVAEILDKGSTSCGVSGALYTLICCVIGCGWLYSCCNRAKMREQYGLEGSCCADCMIHCCCETCALCQEYRELQNRGFNMEIGWHGNVEQQTRGIAMATTAPAAGIGMNR